MQIVLRLALATFMLANTAQAQTDPVATITISLPANPDASRVAAKTAVEGKTAPSAPAAGNRGIPGRTADPKSPVVNEAKKAEVKKGDAGAPSANGAENNYSSGSNQKKIM